VRALLPLLSNNVDRRGLEVAVHKGFSVPHTLLELSVKPASARIVQRSDIPNANWLRPGTVSANQQRFGDDLLD